MKSQRSARDPPFIHEDEPQHDAVEDEKDIDEGKSVDQAVSAINPGVASLVSSAPTSSFLKYHTSTVTSDILETIEKCTKRSKSNLEGNKYKCSITSERLTQLRKTVENATKDHKVFQIKGGWPIIRREMVRRQWIEKNELANKQKYACMDDVTNNLPIKQEWESPISYVEKCEKTVMSRMLQNYDVDFYWSMRKEPSDMHHRNNVYKLINRFSRSLFASKEGLALLLQQAYWYIEEGVASVNFPRCYVLGFPDHYKLFVDDFRITACSGLLKWFTETYEQNPANKHKLMSPDGKVPYAALQFATDRLNEYVAAQKHLDLDREFSRVWDHEWDQFLGHYYHIVHNHDLFVTFRVSFPDHYKLFVDEFRFTACSGLLKWFTETYEQNPANKHKLMSPDGKVPYAALQFATERLNEYVAAQKHLDLDREFSRVWDHEWDQLIFTKEPLTTIYLNVKATLKEFSKYWPQYDIDGMRNIWIMKPGNKCRGRGIQLIKNVADVEKVMSLKLKYVVQKYIEKPMIIYQTKFDIRQWFMVTNVQPLTIWMYRESYLRFSGQVFSLDNFHESLHLTNHAVQCKYTNGVQRDKLLPSDNMWDCHTFRNYLKKIGYWEKWNDVIYPGMKESITCAMLASQDTMDRRQNTYEIYGADFMLSEDFRPWLLEINCSPDLSFSTTVTSRMCPQCMEDIIKVVVDKRKDPNADTGLFELIYKQTYPRTPPYLGMNLSVRGRRLFRSRAKSKSDSQPRPATTTTTTTETKPDKPSGEKSATSKQKQHHICTDLINDSAIKKSLPKLISPQLYKGPVIADLIEELQKSVHDEDNGVDFVPALKSEPHHHTRSGDRKSKMGVKSERVPKYCLSRHKINKSTSLCRKPINAKEKISQNQRPPLQQNKNQQLYEKPTTRINKNQQQRIENYFGLFKDWASRNNCSNVKSRSSAPAHEICQNKEQLRISPCCDSTLWEKETVSILRGENILNKNPCNNNIISGPVVNKNLLNSSCLSCQTFDLNKLLPQINNSHKLEDDRRS